MFKKENNTQKKTIRLRPDKKIVFPPFLFHTWNGQAAPFLFLFLLTAPDKFMCAKCLSFVRWWFGNFVYTYIWWRYGGGHRSRGVHRTLKCYKLVCACVCVSRSVSTVLNAPRILIVHRWKIFFFVRERYKLLCLGDHIFSCIRTFFDGHSKKKGLVFNIICLRPNPSRRDLLIAATRLEIFVNKARALAQRITCDDFVSFFFLLIFRSFPSYNNNIRNTNILWHFYLIGVLCWFSWYRLE